MYKPPLEGESKIRSQITHLPCRASHELEAVKRLSFTASKRNDEENHGHIPRKVNFENPRLSRFRPHCFPESTGTRKQHPTNLLLTSFASPWLPQLRGDGTHAHGRASKQMFTLAPTSTQTRMRKLAHSHTLTCATHTLRALGRPHSRIYT